MNSLELFNQIYEKENTRGYEKSLLDFFKSTVRARLTSNSPMVLDLGAGLKSIFEDSDLLKSDVTALDFSPVAIAKTQNTSEINYQEGDITTPDSLEKAKYDLIFDSHCLHCITESELRQSALKNIYEALSPDGLFAAEMMVLPAGKQVILPNKHVPDARVLEDEILAHGFKIIYFMIVRDLVFENENGKCDLVRVICRK